MYSVKDVGAVVDCLQQPFFLRKRFTGLKEIRGLSFSQVDRFGCVYGCLEVCWNIY